MTDNRAIRWLNTSLDPEKENGRDGHHYVHFQSKTVSLKTAGYSAQTSSS